MSCIGDGGCSLLGARICMYESRMCLIELAGVYGNLSTYYALVETL